MHGLAELANTMKSRKASVGTAGALCRRGSKDSQEYRVNFVWRGFFFRGRESDLC